MSTGQYLTTAQVAERWQCDRTTVTALGRSGSLRGMRIGTAWRFSLASVEAYEQRHTTAARSDASPKPEASRREEQPVTTVDGFTLPADYEPVFPSLWPGHVAKKKAALSAN